MNSFWFRIPSAHLCKKACHLVTLLSLLSRFEIDKLRKAKKELELQCAGFSGQQFDEESDSLRKLQEKTQGDRNSHNFLLVRRPFRCITRFSRTRGMNEIVYIRRFRVTMGGVVVIRIPGRCVMY